MNNIDMNNIDQLLSKLDKNQLADFIRKECMNDRQLQDRFLALGAGKVFKPNEAEYASRVEDLIEDYSGRYGYIDYRSTFDFNRAVSRILDEADEAIDSCQWDVAIAVLKGIASVSEEIINSGDDSAGELGGIVRECFEKWHELCGNTALPDNIKAEIFEYALSRFIDEDLKGWDWWWDWMGMAIDLADTQDRQQEVIKALDAIKPCGDDWSSKDDAETAQRYKLEIISRQGSQEDQIEFMYSHVSIPDFRKRLLQLAWDKSDYDEVLRLAKDGVIHDEEYVGLVDDWHKWEYKVYRKVNDKNNQINLARYFFFQNGALWGDKEFSLEAMYKVLKSLIPQKDWPQYVATLVREVQNKKNEVRLLYILTQEKYWVEYMDYIRKNPSVHIIDDAPAEVKDLYHDDIINLYASAVRNFFQSASNRDQYREGVQLLRNLTDYGGKAETQQIAAEQRSRKPRRPALIDELSKSLS